MNLGGKIIRMRAVEPRDIDALYIWENDVEVWSVSGTIAPFSRHTIERFVQQQQFDIYQIRQLRLVIETLDGTAVGALDLFDFDPLNLRAGIGILIHDKQMRGRGYAADAVTAACEYARSVLGLHIVWCDVGADNPASLSVFRKAGFTEIGIKRDWIRTPDGYKDQILLQKIL